MLRHIAAVTMTVLALAACQKQEPATPQPAVAPTMVPPQPPGTTPAPATVNEVAINGLTRMDGYGDLRFGMTADEVRKAWGGELRGIAPHGEAGACYFLTPTWAKMPSDFSLMIEGDKFVRYDVGTDKEVAPGGGKRGIHVDDIRKRYAGRIEEQPHKYVQGGKYLRVVANDGSNGVLVFEADASGKVGDWRVGQAPQVDYVEGCS